MQTLSAHNVTIRDKCPTSARNTYGCMGDAPSPTLPYTHTPIRSHCHTLTLPYAHTPIRSHCHTLTLPYAHTLIRFQDVNCVQQY